MLLYSASIFGNVTIQNQNSDLNPIPGQQIDTRGFLSGGGIIINILVVFITNNY